MCQKPRSPEIKTLKRPGITLELKSPLRWHVGVLQKGRRHALSVLD